MQFFATCPKGLENLLHDELSALGASEVRATAAGVYFDGDLRVAMSACLWSRLANRILLPLGSEEVTSDYDLYSAAYTLDWENHLAPTTTFAVDFSGTNDAINNTLFGAMRVKDAIVDRVRDKTGERPSVDRNTPMLRINARLAKNKVHIGVDLSGESLHRRGYRLEQGAAPLKENLAAAIVMRAGWPAIAAAGGQMVDPMCGSGTLLIEAALMAGNIAPGLLREKFGFHSWLQFDATIWQEILGEAQAIRAESLARGLPLMRGFDINTRVLDAAFANIQRAGLSQWLRVAQQEVAQLEKPAELDSGLILCNPPYGERLGEIEALRETYRDLGARLKSQFAGWKLGVLTGNKELGQELRLRPAKRYKFFNGTIDTELLLFDLLSADAATLREDRGDARKTPGANVYVAKELSPGAAMVANRLRKNIKGLAAWVKQQNIDAYRLYDADMPEYSAAIDLYAGRIHLQEYAAPKSIDEAAAAKRFAELLDAVSDVFQVPVSAIAVKTRQRNKGKIQYEKLSDIQDEDYFPVTEGRARLLVNLQGYLDSGLFLDHRPLRKRIGDICGGQRFLNLFCYTGSASVHAILGGASRSVSVDMSHTYLNWARRNFDLNNIHSRQHELVQGDCIKWLQNCREGFDVIMLDPPSFSNSKRMDGVLDVQRDHIAMIKRCMEILNPGGVLYFSTNLRTFKLDLDALFRYKVGDMSVASIDPDFARNAKIHQCFSIQHG